MKLNEAIKHIRLLKGMTQQQLAEKIPMSRFNISSLENGRKKPRDWTLKRMAEIFGVKLYYIYHIASLLETGETDETILTHELALTIKELEYIPHLINSSVWRIKLERYRELHITLDKGVGTAYLCEIHPENPKEITDLVCLHNWDYDGYLTLEWLEQQYFLLTKKTFTYK